MLRDNQIKVLWISRIDYEIQTGVSSHTHDDIFQLFYVMNGRGVLMLGNREYELLPKHIYMMFPGEEHNFHFKKPASTIDMKFSVIDGRLKEILIKNRLPLPHFINDDSKIRELFKTSISKINKQSKLTPFRVDTLFKDFILSQIQLHIAKESANANTPINIELEADFPIQKYILENLHKKLTLNDIANQFGYHPHYIIDLFNKRFNVSPMKYLQYIRVEKAKELLELSTLPISEIAEETGLSVPYFSRLFHSIEGVSPSEYRNQTRTVVGKDIVLDDSFFQSLPHQPEIKSED